MLVSFCFLVIVSSQIFENNLGGLNPKNVIKNYLHKNITLPSAPSHIDINSDQQFLSVAFCKNEAPFLRVYETRTLLENVRIRFTLFFNPPNLH